MFVVSLERVLEWLHEEWAVKLGFIIPVKKPA